jgi:probable F420-dependent oxidoreductase
MKQALHALVPNLSIHAKPFTFHFHPYFCFHSPRDEDKTQIIGETMELGVQLPTSGPFTSREAIVLVAQEAERLGYTGLWTYERLLYPLDKITYPGSTEPVILDEFYSRTFEPIETLAYVAAKTEHIKLGTSIVNAPFHSPLVLARRFATLDQFSNGRVIAGLGQGWMEAEFRATNTSRRYQGPAVDEFVAAMRAAWAENPVQFEGTFYQIARSTIDPKPIQKGGIPIIMGVATPAATKRAARIADGLTPLALSPEILAGTVNGFRAAAQEAGRDPSTLKIYARANNAITTNALPEENRPFLSGSPDQIARDLDKIRALNIDHILFAEAGSSAHPDSSLVPAYIENLQRLQAVVRA